MPGWTLGIRKAPNPVHDIYRKNDCMTSNVGSKAGFWGFRRGVSPFKGPVFSAGSK